MLRDPSRRLAGVRPRRGFVNAGPHRRRDGAVGPSGRAKPGQTRRDKLGRGPMPPRIAVTGIGLLSPLGLDVGSTWRGLLEGKSGVRFITDFPDRQAPK